MVLIGLCGNVELLFQFQERDNYNLSAFQSGICRTQQLWFLWSNLFPSAALRRREGRNEKTLGTMLKKNNNTMAYWFCFPDLKNQGDVDETGT